MTVLAAIVHGGRAWLGGDALVLEDHEATITEIPKVRRAGAMLVGACGNLDACQLALEGIQEHAREIDESGGPSSRAFRLAVLERLRESGCQTIEELGLLVVWRGTIWEVEGVAGVVRVPGPHAAMGSAGAYARGALEALAPLVRRSAVRAPTALRRALKIAAECSSTARPPFAVLSGKV